MLSAEELNTTVQFLKNDVAVELCEYQLDCELSQKLGPSFRNSITKIFNLLSVNNGVGSSKQCLDIFVKSVEELHREVEKFWRFTNGRDAGGKFRPKSILMTKAALFHTLWPELRRVTRYIYEKMFAAFFQSENRGKSKLFSKKFFNFLSSIVFYFSASEQPGRRKLRGLRKE